MRCAVGQHQPPESPRRWNSEVRPVSLIEGRGSATEGAPAGEVPEVSVIIPARDEVSTIGSCLDSVLTQDGVSLEVVVVDNGSTDGTTEELRARAATDRRVVVLHNPEPSIPASLNLALSRARGKWLVRVDAHSTIPPGYVAHAVRRLEEGRWVGVGGRKTAVGRTPAGKAIAAVLNSPLAVGGSTYHYGTTQQVTDHIPFGAYATATVRELGGWDTDVPNNEDFEFDQRLRGRGDLLFDPELEIAWQSRETLAQLFRQYRRYGRGKTLVAIRHPASMRIRHFAPPALVLWLATAALVATRKPRIAAAAVTPYLLAVAGAGAAISRATPPGADRRTVPAALVAMQVGWGWGFWQGAADVLRRRPRAGR
ncbi:glycosyltransferase family 2 protein [Modestobacter sp. SYSU DS0657]